MKGELVQVGRCRQLLQDRHLLERKEEEERLRSKVAEVKNVFRQSLFLSFWTKTEFVVCRRSQLINNSCVVSKALADGEEVWHKLSSGNSF